MRRLITLALLVAGLAAPASADAALRHVIDGGGWGHGIGMSQYGAYGFAQHGRDYRQILSHYYRGAELSQSPKARIRVLLRSAGVATFSNASRIPGVRSLSRNRTYVARATGSSVVLRTSRGTLIGRFAAPLVVDGEGEPLRLAGRGTYRGALEIRPGYVVNALDIDDYVRGVVPDEMPPSWALEALKAQSVAARSYALASDAGGAVFDQFADTRSQVYGGVGAEEPRSDRAVRETEGEVLRAGGSVITAFFFSTSGGHTENIENVWRGAAPRSYLKGVEDPYDNISPRHRWRFTFTTNQMQARLGGLVKGRFVTVQVLRRGVSPRIVSADVVGTRGRTRVSGSTLRQRLGVHDNWMSFKRVSTSVARTPRGLPVEPRAGARTSTCPGRANVALWLHGTLSPAPEDGAVTVERRTGGRWRAVLEARTSASGDYFVRLPRAGTYRVRAGRVVGPAVRAR